MIRYFYRVDSQDMITSAYRFIVDEEAETVTDEKWTPNGWVDSGNKVVEFLITGLGDLQEVTELDVKKYSPEILESAEITYISKAVDERRYTLGPMYVPDRVDAHGEWTDSAELQKSVWDYVRKGDRRIRLQHNRDVVAGEFVEVMAWPHEISVPMQKADGSQESVTFPENTVFLGVVWEPWAWEMVKAGELRGYSIGGRAQRLEVDLPVNKSEGMDEDSDDMNVNSVHEDTIMGKPRKKKK